MDCIPKDREDWYIAAPFFNEQQIVVVRQIENILITTRRRFFSPRLSIPSVTARKEGLTDGLAKRIFKVNVDAMNVRCNRVVAYLGWELQEDRAVCEVESLQPNGERIQRLDIVEATSGPLNIPDSGTVWEIGYATCSGIPVFGIFGEGQQPNLMLTQSCAASFENIETFEDWLDSYDLDPSIPVPKWKGAQQ